MFRAEHPSEILPPMITVCSRAAGAILALLVVSAATAQPVNNACGSATLIGFPSQTAGTNVGATADVPSSSCAFTPTDDRDVWYRFIAPATGTYIFDTEAGVGGLADTTLSVWSACPPGGVELACDDDGGVDQRSRLAVVLSAGQNVRVRVAGWNRTTGAFVLRVSGGTPAPANDPCAGAAAVSAGTTVAGSNVGATGSPVSSCGAGDYADVWYRLVAPSTGHYTIETLETGTLTDSTLAVYSACPPGAVELACNDDPEEGAYHARVGVLLTAGQPALIRVAGYGGETGTFSLRVGAPVTPAVIVNDECAGARVIAQLPFADTTTDLAWATDDADLASCDNGENGAARRAVWYTFVPTVSGPYGLRVGAPSGVFVSVLRAGSCAGPFTEVACGVSGAMVVHMTAGLRYYFLVGLAGLATPLPPAVLDFTVEAVVPPVNDLCANAVTLAYPSVVTAGTRGATADVANSSCAWPPNDGLDVWFKFRPPAAGVYLIDTLSTTGGLQDTTLSLWSACPGAGGVELLCNDDFGNVEQGGGLRSAINAQLSPTVEYRVRVSGGGGTFGDFVLSVGPGVVLPNETCSTATFLAAGPHVGSVDTSFARTEAMASAGSCNSASAAGVGRSVWYKFVPGAAGGTLSGMVDALDHDQVVVVYVGSCGGLVELACVDAQPAVLDGIALLPGANHYLCIGAFDDEPGGLSVFDVTIPGVGSLTGACCRGASCVTLAAGACTGSFDRFAGAGTVCNAAPTNAGPCCRADFNGSGGVSVQDIFDYLSAYFAAEMTADLAGGTITVQDLFNYLAAYFTGCG